MNKLEPSEKKGIFVGYYEVSKAFKIYIPGHRHIEISRDVTFDEEAALKKSRRCQLEEVCEEEPVNPRTTESVREAPRYEISLIRLIKIFATILLLLRADLILWGFLDAF
jgi:hypothetical protein